MPSSMQLTRQQIVSILRSISMELEQGDSLTKLSQIFPEISALEGCLPLKLLYSIDWKSSPMKLSLDTGIATYESEEAREAVESILRQILIKRNSDLSLAALGTLSSAPSTPAILESSIAKLLIQYGDLLGIQKAKKEESSSGVTKST